MKFNWKTLLLAASLVLNALGVTGVIPPAATGTLQAVLNALGAAK